MSIWYYKSGEVYEKTLWKNGKKDSVRSRYYRSGKLQAKIPFKDGIPAQGLVEFKKDGTKKKIPTLKFREKNTTLLNGKYTIECYLSNNSWNVEYYELRKDVPPLPIHAEKGLGKVEFHIPSHIGMIRKMVISAHHTTRLNNSVVLVDTLDIVVAPYL